jgi:hypothetical protein
LVIVHSPPQATDRRGVREDPAAPFVEVVVDAERPAGYPRVPVDSQFPADPCLPGAIGLCPRDDLAVTHDLE